MELILDYGLSLAPGPGRVCNQDRCAALAADGESQCRQRDQLFVLADGMGGLSAGEVAAEIVIQSVQGRYLRGGANMPAAALRAAFQTAHEAILAAIHADGLADMGAAAVAAAIVEDQLLVAHLGHSRCYLVRDGRATCLTADHTLGQQLVAAGCLAAPELRTHPWRKVLTGALGVGTTAEPSVKQVELRVGDGVLLCSDGLWSVADDEELAGVVSAAPDSAHAARMLVDLAQQRGTPDDVSAIVVRVTGANGDAPAKCVMSRSRRFVPALLHLSRLARRLPQCPQPPAPPDQ